MSKLLLDEAPLQVQASLAIAIGLNEAITLQQLHWVLQNPNMGKTVDGNRYVYMSIADWRKGHFPFWSNATIQRNFDSLEKMNLVSSRDDLNQLHFDRTKWYCIEYATLEDVERSLGKNERVIEHSKMKNGHRKMKNALPQNETTIPESSSSESSSDNSIPPSAENKKPESEIQICYKHNTPNVLIDGVYRCANCDYDSMPSASTGVPDRPLTADGMISPQMAMVGALADVCGVEIRLVNGKYASAAARLVKARYTAEQVRSLYGHGGEWYQYDWRGQRSEPPNIATINETIKRAVSGDWRKQNANAGRPRAPTLPTDRGTRQTMAEGLAMMRSKGLLE